MKVMHEMYLAPPMVLLAATGSAVLNTIDTVLWIPVGVLFIALLLFMSIDLWMCHSIHQERESENLPTVRASFPWTKEITSKLFLFAIVVISLILDIAIFTLASYASDHMERDFWLLANGFLFITIWSQLWLVGAQVKHILDKIALREGRHNIPPHLYVFVKRVQTVMRGMREIDEKRMSELSKTPKKNDRWYDEDQDDDEMALAFVKFLAQQRRTERADGPSAELPPELSADGSDKEEKHDNG